MICTSKVVEIYQKLTENDVLLFTGRYNFDCGADAAIICLSGKYGFFLDIDKIKTVTDENMALGHEWGHFITGSTHLVGASAELTNWCERKAYKAQIRTLIPFDELDNAVLSGKTSVFDLAEHFDVTEKFVKDALNYYLNEKGYSFSKLYSEEIIM